ncbi:BNR repeat-like domain-containing protein [Spirosomataceae bacterium TFI 002]|nr:BNR repeat-like domain-containing protein [Spirosomataceae bacterium TFI 002]
MKNVLILLLIIFTIQPILAQNLYQDPSLQYSYPTLAQTPDGQLFITWIEKDKEGMVSFCMSFADEDTQNFNSKKVIVSGYGVGSSRLMPAKLLTKKDGTLTAVLRYNPDAKPGGGRGGFLAFTTSTYKGKTWSEPKSVDNDDSPGLRGFHDAIVLSNDEIAVAYLKDVKNSKKREERDLRIAITKNGKFQNEQLIDAVVCDCCNISLLVDNSDNLNIYYRDNNDDIRDIGHKVSKDNGKTFSDSKILYPDNWSIKGCPHNGSVSASMGNQNLITWYSAGDNEPGIRLVKENGEKLVILTESSAQNSKVTAGPKKALFYWQEMNEEINKPMIAYSVVSDKGISEKHWIKSDGQAINASALLVKDQVIIAFETEENSIKLIKEKI